MTILDVLQQLCYSPEEKRARGMPDNIASFLSKIPVEFMAPFLAMISSVVTILYKSDKTSIRVWRVIAESVTCLFFGLTVVFGFKAFGIENDNLMICTCLMIGNIGAASVRAIAMRFINKKVDDYTGKDD